MKSSKMEAAKKTVSKISNMFHLNINLSGKSAAITGITGILTVCGTVVYTVKEFFENGYSINTSNGLAIGPSDKIFPAATIAAAPYESTAPTDPITAAGETKHLAA